MKKILVSLFVVLQLWGFSQTNILPSDPAILYSGRINFTEPDAIVFSHTGIRIRTIFEGTSIKARLNCSFDDNYFVAIVDGKQLPKLCLPKDASEMTIAENLNNGTHTLELVKATECLLGPVSFRGFVLDEGKTLIAGTEREERQIHFIGNSITCGYGIEAESPYEHFEAQTENFYEAYAAITARELNADYLVVARSGIGVYRNYGEASEGSEENMRVIYNRVIYDDSSSVQSFGNYQPDVVCVNLGTNDYSTNGVNDELFKEAYLEFLDTLMARYPQSKIVLLAGPMLNSSLYTNNLKAFVEKKNTWRSKRVSFFEMSAQGGLGYGADWHPSKDQARKSAGELIGYLSGLMGWENKAVLQEAVVASVGERIDLRFKESISDTSISATGFSVVSNGETIAIDSVCKQDDNILSLYIKGQIMPLAKVEVHYTGESAMVFGGKRLAQFQNVQVGNTLSPTMAYAFDCDLVSVLIRCNTNIKKDSYTGFTLTNEVGMPIAFDSVALYDSATLRMFLADSAAGKALLVSYNGGNVRSEDSILLSPFSNKVAEYMEETGLKKNLIKTDKLKIYPLEQTEDGITIELIEPQFRDVEIRFYTLQGSLLLKADLIREKTHIKNPELKNAIAYATIKGFFNESVYKDTIPIMFK